MRIGQIPHGVPYPFQPLPAIKDVLCGLNRGLDGGHAAGHPFESPSLSGVGTPAGPLQVDGDPVEPRPDGAARRVVALAVPEGDHENIASQLVRRVPPGVAGEEGPDGGVVPVEDDPEALGLDQGPGYRVCIVVRPHVQYFAAGAAEFQKFFAMLVVELATSNSR